MATVHFYGAAKAAAGATALEISAQTLGALINELSGREAKLAELLPKCSYLLNSEACKDFDQLLNEGDQVDVLPQFAGGSN